MNKPSVSVVITARNEYPIILGTILSFYEELTFWGYEFEIIVVDNMSNDLGPQVIKDKFRRWIREGILRVIEFNERAGNVLVRNVGAREAKGDVVILCDAHLSIARGAIHGMVQNWSRVGGLWHPSIHSWGDTSDIRCYGYRLALEQKFWGNLSRYLPDYAKTPPKELPEPPEGLEDRWLDGPFPHQVPMASHCCILVGRKEYLELGGYHDSFRCYGGGEPFLDLLYWLMGRAVWIEPRALVRHATFSRAQWKKLNKDHEGGPIWVKGRGLTKKAKSGEERLAYGRGYGFTNEQLHFNFMLSAFVIGGVEWLDKIYRNYYEVRKINPRYVQDLKQLRREVIREGMPKRQWVDANAKMTLNEVLEKKPWEPVVHAV